jgi:hypothetical protein
MRHPEQVLYGDYLLAISDGRTGPRPKLSRWRGVLTLWAWCLHSLECKQEEDLGVMQCIRALPPCLLGSKPSSYSTSDLPSDSLTEERTCRVSLPLVTLEATRPEPFVTSKASTLPAMTLSLTRPELVTGRLSVGSCSSCIFNWWQALSTANCKRFQMGQYPGFRYKLSRDACLSREISKLLV